MVGMAGMAAYREVESVPHYCLIKEMYMCSPEKKTQRDLEFHVLETLET